MSSGYIEDDSEAELKRQKTALLRKRSSFRPVVVETSTTSLEAPNWTLAWTQFLGECGGSAGDSFHRNAYLKGAWAAMEFVIEEFEKCAIETAVTLVNERDMEPHEQSIPAIDAGGIAGGEKFVHFNIFCKFAVDLGIYGGDNHAAAAKACSRELRNLGFIAELIVAQRRISNGEIVIESPKIRDCFIPFALIVDYKGFRVFASSMIPISDSTLAYGSADVRNKPFNNLLFDNLLVLSFVYL